LTVQGNEPCAVTHLKRAGFRGINGKPDEIQLMSKLQGRHDRQRVVAQHLAADGCRYDCRAVNGVLDRLQAQAPTVALARKAYAIA
jgi:hypothetical protein